MKHYAPMLVNFSDLAQPEETVCCNCEYFIQHFAVWAIKGCEVMNPVYMGHCRHPKTKRLRMVGAMKKCESFKRRDE